MSCKHDFEFYSEHWIGTKDFKVADRDSLYKCKKCNNIFLGHKSFNNRMLMIPWKDEK